MIVDNFEKLVFFTMRYGIDISAYQGMPDFGKVAEAGYSFCFVKATEGLKNRNLTQDIQQARQAKQAGLDIGYYHYALGQDPKAEADAFGLSIEQISRAIGYRADFPLVLDIEDNKIKEQGRGFDRWVNDFSSRIEKYGYSTWLYSYTPYLNQRTAGGLTHLPLWIASYPKVFNESRRPTLPRGWQDFVCWQYSGSGRVAGIAGAVDLNIMP